MNQTLRNTAYCGLLACCLFGPMAAGSAPFSRYQVILDRHPFGAVTPVQQTQTAPPPAEIPPFVKDLRMCAVTENDAGVRVGFVNIASKPMDSYFLYIGETSDDGITVMDADFEKEGAKLRKDGQAFWIYMSGAPELAESTPAQAATPGSRSLQPSTPSSPTSQRPGSTKRLSYAERLRMRREALRETQEAKPALQGEELQEHLKKYQMDLIRQGMPPLPMPLTKEMDDQLVAEGILPPAE